MKIIATILLGSIIFTGVFIVIGVIIEKNFDESHPVKKWWRKHIIDNAPQDIDI